MTSVNRLCSPLVALRHQRGYTLIELGIAVAIVAVITIGGLLGVQGIIRDNRTNELLKEIPLYIAEATKVTATQPNLSGVSTLSLVNLGVFPAERSTVTAAGSSGGTGTATVSHGHGGKIVVQGYGSSAGNYGANQTFMLSLTKIPKLACADIATGLDKIAYMMNIESTTDDTIGTVTAAQGATLAKVANTAALNLAAVASACGAGDSGSTKRITIIVPRA